MFKSLNWIDLLITLIFARTLYIAYKSGFIIELFKSLGVFFAVLFSFHYFSKLSDLVSSWVTISVSAADTFVLTFLVFLIILIFKFIRDAVLVLFKIEAISLIDKWVALIFGIFRAILISSLMIVILLVTTNTYFENSVNSSYTGKKFLNISTGVYSYCFGSVFSRFFSKDKINTAIFSNLNLEK